MLNILLIFLLLLGPITEAFDKDELHEAQKKCKEEAKLDDKTFDTMKKSGLVDDSDMSSREYLKCLAIKLDLMEEDGNLKKDNIATYFKGLGLSDDIIKKANDECDSIDKPDDIALLTTRYGTCYNQFVPVDQRITSA